MGKQLAALATLMEVRACFRSRCTNVIRTAWLPTNPDTSSGSIPVFSSEGLLLDLRPDPMPRQGATSMRCG